MELIRKSDALHAVLHNQGDAAVAAVQNIKPVDAVPVVHGEWLEQERTYLDESHLSNYLCSRCGKVCGVWRCGLSVDQLPNYCGNCGCRMDGERKDGERDV